MTEDSRYSDEPPVNSFISDESSKVIELRAALRQRDAELAAANERELTMELRAMSAEHIAAQALGELNRKGDVLILRRQLEEAVEKLAAAQAERERLRGLITANNTRAKNVCAVSDCDMYKRRGMICPECPTDWEIDLPLPANDFGAGVIDVPLAEPRTEETK